MPKSMHFLEILENHDFRRKIKVVRSGGAREAEGSVRGVAVAGPETRGMLGMLSLMPIRIFMGAGGPNRFIRGCANLLFLCANLFVLYKIPIKTVICIHQKNTKLYRDVFNQENKDVLFWRSRDFGDFDGL